MKKLLLLSLTMLLPVLIHADGIEINGIYYNLVSKLKQAEVTSNPNYYTGSVDIPSTVTYEGVTYDVIKIGYRAFHSCENLTSVSIPNSVTSIEENAFYNCKKMTNITIPNSVTSLGRKSFYNCQNLTSITIGTGLAQIGKQAFNLDVNIKKVIIKDIAKWCEISFGDNPIEWGNGRIYSDENTEITELSIPQGVNLINHTAFRGCKYLTSITIPPSVNTIKYAAFERCVGLTNIDIPNSVTYLAGFNNCTGLKTILIPTSVTSIGGDAFYGCTGFTSVDIPNSVTTIEGGAFCLTNIKEITIPNSVERIDNVAFYGCPKLTNVVIGSGIKTIGERAFAECQEITDVYCYAEQIPQTYSDVFNNSLIEYATLHVPETAVENYKSTAPWSGFKTIVGIEETTSENTINGHEYVDLGLPSGKCWATMNYGATSPEGYGSYLEWSSNSIISSNWGSGWTTPSLQDIRELENNCTWTWGQKNGHSGYTVKGKNGNSIFLPASGYMMMGQSSAGKVDQWVYYWTSTKSGEMASIILSTATDVWYGEMNTVYTKLPIRPITKESHSTVVQKCETPIISYNNGKLTFACSTEDATCQYSITDSDIKVGSGNEVQLSVTYNISVYATKAGYENSETATATLCWIDQQPATEGITDGIANVPAKALLIKNNGGQLTIEGAADGEAISVYTVNGIQSGSAISQNGAAYIDTNLQAGSIAIVKIGNKSVKVVIK